MPKSVDKEVEDISTGGETELGSFVLSDRRADNYLTTCWAYLVGEDVWRVDFATQTLIEELGSTFTDKDERDVPVGERKCCSMQESPTTAERSSGRVLDRNSHSRASAYRPCEQSWLQGRSCRA